MPAIIRVVDGRTIIRAGENTIAAAANALRAEAGAARAELAAGEVAGALAGKADVENGLQPASALTQIAGSTKTVALSFTDENGLAALTLFTDGTTELALSAGSRAAIAIASQIEAVSFKNFSRLAQVGLGTALGSPASNTPVAAATRGADGRFLFGALEDGTFQIGKYDSNIAGLVDHAFGDAANVFVSEDSGQIVSWQGSTKVPLTTEGVNTSPQRYTRKIAFLSNRLRGITAPYQMNFDGSNQRAMLHDVVYDAFFITGQSNAMGQAAAISKSTPYRGKALTLQGGPVTANPVVISGAATLVDVGEQTYETIATGFSAAVLDHELAQRARLKLVVFGSAKGGTAYSGVKKGTATYADVIAQIGMIHGFGKTIVRGFAVLHGETNQADATYAASLLEWQANYEADIKAVTGQGEPVFMFISQLGNMRQSQPANLTAFVACLLQLEASITSNKIILVVPDYIFTFAADNLHVTAAGQRLRGEYFAKAYRKVVCEGRDWRGVSPKTYTLGADYVDIQFHVPIGPLVLDEALCTNPGNFGFMYSDASARTITGVAVTNGTTVRVQLSGAIGAAAILDYAYSNGTANFSGPTAGARGCLRDSDPALSRYDGATHLYNPCVTFRKALN